MSKLNVLLLIVILISNLSFAQESDGNTDNISGIVFAYGVRIEPPYIFSGIGTDTLFLNGLPYSPRRPMQHHHKKVDIDSSFARKVKQIRELDKRARKIALEKGRTMEERTEIYANITRTESTLVEHVYISKDHNYVKVKYFGFPIENTFMCISDDDIGPKTNPISDHENLMNEFWDVIRSRGLLAFGSGYRILCPHDFVQRTLELIDRIQSGDDNFTDSTFRGTPLQNRKFRDELYREINRTRKE